jgi:hypothetical protein
LAPPTGDGGTNPTSPGRERPGVVESGRHVVRGHELNVRGVAVASRQRAAVSARRYLVIVQAERGYAAAGELEPAPPNGPGQPMIHTAVLEVDYQDLEAERDSYWQALVDIAGYEGWEASDPAPKAMGDIARAALEQAARP